MDTNNAAPKVKMVATGVVRDRFGNIKHEVVITGEASQETWDRLTGKETENGGDSPDCDGERGS